MSVTPSDRCHNDVLNEAADLNLTSQAYHMAVDGDKSVTAKDGKKVFMTGAPGKVECRPDGSSSEGVGGYMHPCCAI